MSNQKTSALSRTLSRAHTLFIHHQQRAHAARLRKRRRRALFNAAKNGDVGEVAKILNDALAALFEGDSSYGNAVRVHGPDSPEAQEALHESNNFWVNFINSKSKGGETPLFIAAKNGRYEVVKQLMEQLVPVGGDFNIPVDGGETPLYVAARAGHADVADLIGDEMTSEQYVNARAREIEAERAAARVAEEDDDEEEQPAEQDDDDIFNPMHDAARAELGGGRRCRRKTRRRKTRRRKTRRRKTRRRKTHSLRKRKTRQKK